MRKIEIDTETDKMETIVFSTLETIKGKPLTAFLTHHFCAVHLLEMRNQVQFALKRVEINIHLLERGVSKKSVTVFSDSHRRITWSGMPGSQRLLRFVSCGRTPQGSPRRRLQPTRPLAAWELETPIQGPFLLKPVFQLQPFCKPMMFFKKLAVGKERQLIHMVSCILAWKLPWAEESSRLQSHEATRVRHK